MTDDENIKLLLHITDQLYQKNKKSGETVIQKLIYFIMKAKLYPFSYDFTLYNYGPYSFSLKDDLIKIEDSRMVFKVPDPSGYGFNYIPNKEMKFVSNSLEEMRFQPKIDELIKKFKKIPAKHLGLLATFVYTYDKYERKINDEELMKKVMEIKPMFSIFEIQGILERHNNLIKGKYEDFLSEIPS